MNDADHITSPAYSRQTVGNSSESSQKRRSVQILEKDDTFALGAMWAAFQRTASPELEKLSKPLTHPQISLYGTYYGTLIPNTESGEVTVSSGTVVQVLDYYPFGDERINNQYGSTDEVRKFVGMERDDSTGLDYAKARYYDNTRGQFISQDPVFWEIGQSRDGKAALLNPQSQNSYSYALNNPIVHKDPDGKFVPQVVALGFLYGGLANVAFQGYAGNINSFGDLSYSFFSGGAVTAASIVNPLFGGGAAASLSLAGSAGRNGGNLTAGDAVNAGAQGLVTLATGGFLKGLPGVSGPQASKIFGGNYFSGAHGTRYAQEAAFGFGTDVYHHNVQQITQSLLNFYAPQMTSGSGGGGGGNINQLSQSVINYASNPGANLSDPGFVAGIRAINEYNNSLTTPSKK